MKRKNAGILHWCSLPHAYFWSMGELLDVEYIVMWMCFVGTGVRTSTLLNYEKKTLRLMVNTQYKYLWSSTADLTNITIVNLGWFGRLFWFQLFILEWCFFSKGGPCPGSCCCSSSSCCCCLLLLLLLLLVVGRRSWIYGCFITWIRRTLQIKRNKDYVIWL